MKTDIKERRARMVATLEKQFDDCRELAEKLFGEARDHGDYFHMPIAMALLRIGGQLSTTVMRLDAASEDALTPEHANRGSIPK